MIMTTDSRGGTVVVTLSGEIDLQHSPALRKTLVDLMMQRKAVVVDMGAIVYIDSSGIASLVEAYQMARDNRTRFILAAVSAPAMRVLRLARLDRVFALADSVGAALAG